MPVTSGATKLDVFYLFSPTLASGVVAFFQFFGTSSNFRLASLDIIFRIIALFYQLGTPHMMRLTLIFPCRN
jgi:hypothetical protein